MLLVYFIPYKPTGSSWRFFCPSPFAAYGVFCLPPFLFATDGVFVHPLIPLWQQMEFLYTPWSPFAADGVFCPPPDPPLQQMAFFVHPLIPLFSRWLFVHPLIPLYSLWRFLSTPWSPFAADVVFVHPPFLFATDSFFVHPLIPLCSRWHSLWFCSTCSFFYIKAYSLYSQSGGHQEGGALRTPNLYWSIVGQFLENERRPRYFGKWKTS